MTARFQAHELSRSYILRQGLWQKKQSLQALREVTFHLDRGKTLGVVGESGCGKSTLARVLALLEPPSGGLLMVDGKEVDWDKRIPLAQRRQIQMVFQDPYGSLNPRKKVESILEEPLIIHTNLNKQQRAEAVRAMLKKVGLRPEQAHRYPHMFSGGQRQRIAIARALMAGPEIVIADEAVSALDLSVQAQIINLLMDLQDEMGLSYIFIAHDLSVVRHIAHDVAVMYLGRIVEYGNKQTIFDRPAHPYTQALLSSTPHTNPEQRKKRIVLKGEIPSPLNPPSGCAFRTRCPYATDRCRDEFPELREVQGRQVACHYAEEIIGKY